MAPLNITAFAEAWTALYAHFNAIGYLPSKSVVYPPFSPALPLVHDSIDLHPLILELLPILPHPVSYEVSCSFEVLPNTRAVPYTEHTNLRLSRDPLKYYLDGIVDEEYVTKELSAEEVLLTTQLPYGWSLILNVASGTLREYSTSEYPPVQEDKLVVPEDPYDYRNWPQLPAVETVWSYVRKFESLEWIAFCGDVEGGIIESFGHEHPELKRILIDKYGWPDAFRRDDWIRERDGIHNRLVKEYYAQDEYIRERIIEYGIYGPNERLNTGEAALLYDMARWNR